MRVDLIEEENEAEIVPSNLHPQPPRKTRSLVHLYIPTEDYDYHQKEIIFENESPYQSDESSDSLLSASKCVEQKKVHNNNRDILNTIMDARERAIQQEKRRKKTEMIRNIKRSESFRHDVENITIKQNSLDGMFYVTTPSTPKHRKKSFNEQKKKSKSLDRIDDGLDSMVDIIVTNQNVDQRLHTKSDSGHVTEVSVSRSTSNNYSQVKFPKYEEKRMFLPYRYDNFKESQFYFPRVQETPNNFLIKRGHTNAGLYSGHHLRESPNTKRASVVTNNSYRTTSSKNHSVSIGKFTDLPSGLY